VALGATTPHGVSLCLVGWWADPDVAATLVAVGAGRPLLWYNRRLVGGALLTILELRARRLLRDGVTFDAVSADELAALTDASDGV